MSGNPMVDAALKKGAVKLAAYAVPGAGEAVMAKNAAQLAMKPVFWLVSCCTCVMFTIFMGTFIGSFTSKDSEEKKRLKGTWIAFLVLFVCCAGIAFSVHKAMTFKIGGII